MRALLVAPEGPHAQAAVDAFVAAGGEGEPAGRALVATLGAYAPALVPLVVSDPSIVPEVLRGGLTSAVSATSLVGALRAEVERVEDGPALSRALRRFRHRNLVRLGVREISGLADVDATAAEMAALASACIEVALEGATSTVEARHGASRTVAGTPMRRVVLGMGKLGGAELNLGSDVDLIFFYETDEGAARADELTVHEVEAKIATRTVKLLSEATEDGFVFRVDLRLRPEGSRGPVACSVAAAERYYETFGRPWERAVLLRSAPIAGDRALGHRLLETLSPFVFRRVVDPTIARAMQDMLVRSRRELGGAPDSDIKLGRGGIREAEFFVQTLQLVWGGRHPELRVPGTLDAMKRLRAAGLVSDREARDLENAWALLRRVEHRIHVWAGYQSHRLPVEGDLERFARSLGFADAAGLDAALSAARERVAALFATVVEETSPGTSRSGRLADRVAEKVGSGAPQTEIEADVAELFGTEGRTDGEASYHVLRLARHASDPLGPLVHARHPRFGASLLEEIADTADPVQALRFTADFFGRLRGWDYVSLLGGDPRLCRRFVALFGASQTLSTALVGHPEDLDVLFAPGVVDDAEIDALHGAARALAGEADAEALVSALRRAKRETTLRVGIGVASGELDEARASRLLGRAARHQIEAALAFAAADLRRRFGVPGRSVRTGRAAGLCVVAMGRLGAGELGFASDLDLVFFYDADGETEGAPAAGLSGGLGRGKTLDHAELFARMAQATMRLLSQPDAEGPGYATDMRLRPSGSQGTLVSSLEAFERHHAGNSEAWERMALVRATPVAGDGVLADIVRGAIDAVRWTRERIARAEVASLKQRIEHELAHERVERGLGSERERTLASGSAANVHPKLGRGGILEVEMLAQVLALDAVARGAGEALRSPGAREALAALERAGVLGAGEALSLREAYTFLRTLEQAIRLLDEAGDGSLHIPSRLSERVCRQLAIRARADRTASEVLASTYLAHTTRVRAAFERHVGLPPKVAPG